MTEAKREVWAVENSIGAIKFAHPLKHIAAPYVAGEGERLVRYIPAPSDQAQSSGVERAVEGDPWEALLKHSRDSDAEHAGNGPTFCFTHEGDDQDKPASVWLVDGSMSGEGATATEAARDLCAKLGLPVAPVASPKTLAGSPGGDTENTDPSPTERHSGKLGTVPGHPPVASPAAEAGKAQAEWSELRAELQKHQDLVEALKGKVRSK